MDQLEIALAAADRWIGREVKRKEREGLLPSEIETPERLQKHLDRVHRVSLRQAAMAPSEAELLELRGGKTALERTIGDRDFLSIAFVEHALAVARYVGRVIIRSSPRTNAGFGTGFMVSPRLMLTNHHVLPDEAVAAHSEVEFDFQRDRFNRMMTSVYFRFEPQTFFLKNQALDFTLVAVSERSRDGLALNPYGWSRLIPEEGKVLIGNPLNIIQHPRGEHKQIVVRSNKLVDLLDEFAHYTTDTEQGSSGSPVFNDQWEVIALHHSGVPKRNDEGQLVARSGEPWQRRIHGLEDLVWVANEGIRISRIVQHIETASLPPAWAPLRRELLDLDPPDPLEAVREELRASRANNGETSRKDGHVTVSVPLQITVSLGAAAEAPREARAELPPADSGLPARNADAGAAPAVPAVAAGLTQALSELREAAERPYYDAEADALKRAAYWAPVAALDLTPRELFGAIGALLERTHLRPLRYKPSRDLHPWVDLHPGEDRVVRSIYSGKSFDPADLIREDFRTEAIFEEAATRLEASLEGSTLESMIDALEAQLPYNCEHVVPQSWFEKREPMRGDVHHLFTCEARCNSFRGNTPYFEFNDFREAIQSDCGKREGERFEPNAGKGAVARATLYFLLRNPAEIERLPDQYDDQRIAMLLGWHKAHPVDDYERHRNAAIEEKQGNRNPLIDFPDWSDRIDFLAGLGGVAP